MCQHCMSRREFHALTTAGLTGGLVGASSILAADSPTVDAWDGDACYKPFAIFDEEQNRWLLWYNGRKGGMEQIGMAIHPGADLGFPGP